MRGAQREYFSPVDTLAEAGVVHDWITFDPKVVPQFHIIRSATHDGTRAFTMETVRSALAPLVNRTAYYRSEPPPEDAQIRYVVGWARLTTAFGRVWLPCSTDHKYPGQRERIRIPVRVILDAPPPIAPLTDHRSSDG